MTAQRKFVEHPSAWKGSDFSGKDDIAFDLADRHIDAFEQALQRCREMELELIGQREFDLTAIAGDVAAWKHEVLHGRGLLLLRGIPVEHYSMDEISRIYWGLGTYFGRAESQSTMGDRLGQVIDVAGKDPRERAYRNSTELALHTDACDVVAMLCLRKAASGGVSGFASGLAIYNELLATQPRHLGPLCDGFHYHRFGEQAPGESPVTAHKVPVFSERDGLTSICYLRSYIDIAEQEGYAVLTDADVEALDAFDDVSNRADVRFDFMLEPGEVSIYNNYTVLHTRTAFYDHDDPALKRHMLRLWLTVPDGRPVVDAIRAYEGRGGISPRDDGSTYYDGDIEYQEFGRRSAQQETIR